ncbi:hypothetical protein [Hyphomonas sp.]|uniref:hypothetical protein n=1 Tax=Hyphomonas sp. TaxID=87 RepID=UPI0025BBF9B6|nr:hypothetical protein [Hyphomonas sp.]
MRSIIVAAALCLAASPAWACYTVKVNNTSGQNITVVWKALGCGGIFHKTELVTCAHSDVANNSTASYDYDWGHTAPSVYVWLKNEDTGKYLKFKTPYVLHGGSFTRRKESDWIPASPSGCHKHYTITYDKYTYEDDYWSYTN